MADLPPTYSINDTKIWDDKNKRFMSLSAMAERLKEEAVKQMSELMNDADTGRPIPKPEYAKIYLEKRDRIIRFIEETMAANIATQLFQEISEDMFQEFSSDHVNVANPNTFGSWIGGFVEQNIFGLKKGGNSPFPDLRREDIEVELKAHTSSKETLQVAGITLESVPKEMSEEKRAINVATAYRMFLKMQNFLLFRMTKENVTKRNGKSYRKVHYDDISLHMTLILKEVWNIIFSKTVDTLHGAFTKNPNKVVFVERESAWENGKAVYNVKLDLSVINGVYNFVKLYLYHLDLLSEIKTNDGVRRTFFRNINIMKNDWKSKNLGTSPDFNITIK